MEVFLKRFFLILFVCLCLGIGLSFAVLWGLRKGNFYKPSFVSNTLKGDSFDYVILGASTGLTTLDTELIDELSGLKGINLSIDDTSLASSYLMLQHLLTEGIKTSYVVLSPNNLNYGQKTQPLSDNDYRFLMYGHRDYVQDYYGSFHEFPSRILSTASLFPLFGVGYYNAELIGPSVLSVAQPSKHNRFNAKGNYTYPKNQVEDVMIEQKTTKSIYFENPWLSRIALLCETHGIQLIYYLSPMKEFSLKPERSMVPVINHTDLLTHSYFFYDGIHVNSLGRERVSEAFSKKFKAYMIGNKQ